MPARAQRSGGEILFSQHLAAALVRGWQTEMPFAMHLGRKWRFDFAFPAEMIAIDIQGGTWGAGRNSHGHGYKADVDAEKLTVAAILGWRVMTFTTKQIKSGWALLATEIALGKRSRSMLSDQDVRDMACSKTVRAGRSDDAVRAAPRA